MSAETPAVAHTHPWDAYQHGKLIVAACDSYDKHFGPGAVAAAEEDLLGAALKLVADFAFCATPTSTMGRPAVKMLLETHEAACALIARVKEESKL